MNKRLKYLVGIVCIALAGTVVTSALDTLTGTSFSKDTPFWGQGLHDLVKIITGSVLGAWIVFKRPYRGETSPNRYPSDEELERIRRELQRGGGGGMSYP